MPSPHLLLIEDDDFSRGLLAVQLEAQGIDVGQARSCREGLQAFQEQRPDVVVTDHELGDGTALDLLPAFKQMDPAVPVILLTGHGSIDLAVRAVKEGAEQFLTKPPDVPALAVLVQRAFDQRRLRRRDEAGRNRERKRLPSPFLGRSALIRQLEAQAAKVAAMDAPVLILGETGVGKSTLAKWIHQNGPRSEEAFVDLNCAGLSRDLLESELFGYERGAFTGAVAAKPGLLEAGDRGTLFLDELGDMDLGVQPKLLKVLEERTLRRLGSLKERSVDVRLIAATHQDLEAQVQARTFRSDLYYRISALPIRIPALRERPEDIPVLAAGMVEALSQRMGRELRLDPGALDRLQACAWPGNIRELRNVLERACLYAEGSRILEAHLGLAPSAPPAPGALPVESRSLKDLERQHIQATLEAQRWNVSRTARELGISRSSLYEKMRQYGLHGDGGREAEG